MDPESGSLGPLSFVPDPYPPKAIRTADVATISNMSKNSFIISVIICFGCKLCSSHARSWLTVDLIAQIVAFFDPDRHTGVQWQARVPDQMDDTYDCHNDKRQAEIENGKMAQRAVVQHR